MLFLRKCYSPFLFLWLKLAQVEIKGKCLTLPHIIPVITGVNVGEIEVVVIGCAQVLYSLLVSMVAIGTSRD